MTTAERNNNLNNKVHDKETYIGQNCLQSRPRSEVDEERMCCNLVKLHTCVKLIGTFTILAGLFYLLNLILFFAEVGGSSQKDDGESKEDQFNSWIWEAKHAGFATMS